MKNSLSTIYKTNLFSNGRNSNTTKFIDLITLGTIFPGFVAQNKSGLLSEEKHPLWWLLKVDRKPYVNIGTYDFVSESHVCAISPTWHTLRSTRFSARKECAMSTQQDPDTCLLLMPSSTHLCSCSIGSVWCGKVNIHIMYIWYPMYIQQKYNCYKTELKETVLRYWDIEWPTYFHNWLQIK